MQKKKTILHQKAIQQLQNLKTNGCRTGFIARYASITFGTHRTTAYRHVSDNEKSYKWNSSWRENKRRELEERDKYRCQVCERFASGQNTRIIAGEMGRRLEFINSIAISCRKDYPELFIHER